MDRETLDRVLTDIRTTIRDEVAGEMRDETKVVVLESRGTTKLLVMPDENGEALAQVSMRRDTTVSARIGRAAYHDHMGISVRKLEEKARERTVGRFGRKLDRITSLRTILQDPVWAWHAEQAIEESTIQVMQESLHRKADQKTGETSLERIVREANALILEKIVHPQAARIAITLQQRQGQETVWEDQDALSCPAREYNKVAACWSGLAELERSSPGLARYYFTHMAANLEKKPKAEHPGQLIQVIKEEMKLSPAGWSIFCRIAHGLSMGYGAAITNVRRTCETLAKANVPQASDQKLEEACHMEMMQGALFQQQGRASRAQHRDEWEHGDTHPAWVMTLNRYLKSEGNPRELQRVCDTLVQRVLRNETWGHGTWEQLLGRSERWHTEKLSEKERAILAQKNASWKSLVGEFHDGESIIRPLQSYKELRKVSEEMRNCLETYGTLCQGGSTRVFTVERNGGVTAAIEIKKHGGEWMVGQLEMKGRAATTDRLKAQGQEVARRYRVAEATAKHRAAREE